MNINETIFKLKPKQKPTIDNGGVIEIEKVSDHPEWQDYLNHLSKLPASYNGDGRQNWYGAKIKDKKRLLAAEAGWNESVQHCLDNPTKPDRHNIVPTITKKVEKIIADLSKNQPDDNPELQDKNLYRLIPPKFLNGDNQLHFTDEEDRLVRLYGLQCKYRKVLFLRHCFVNELIQKNMTLKEYKTEDNLVAKLNLWLVARLNNLPLIEEIYHENALRSGNHFDVVFMKPTKVGKTGEAI
ncbi:MAG: hypothetical protein KZQ83_18800 [gamma proteobacterium symbiont of Taylorina sp.]|nr:hypothetical protein [gamma proteobacterium symbiont of Taylorina sp.]